MNKLVRQTMQTIRLNPGCLFAAFFGGTCLSLSELMSMFSKHQGADIFFFGGMCVAGIMGIAAYIVAGAENLKTAFLSGVAAPQLLGGLLKAGASGATVVGMVLSLNQAYAQPVVDNTRVYVNSSIDEVLTVKVGDSTWQLKDTLTLPAEHKAVITGNSFRQELQITGREAVINVRYARPMLQKALSLSRGMFGTQMQDAKIKVTLEKK